MSRFYVGQRIRKVRGDARNIGMVARVLSFGGSPFGAGQMRIETESCGFSSATNRWCPAGVTGWTHSDHWEPLTPPHEAGDWSVIDKMLPNLRGVTA